MILFAAAGEVMTLLKVILLAKHHSFQIIICEFDFAIYSQHFQNNFIRYHGMLPWDHFHSLAFNKISRFSKWGKINLFFFSPHLYSRIKIILSKVQFVMSRPVEINQSIYLCVEMDSCFRTWEMISRIQHCMPSPARPQPQSGDTAEVH